MTVESGEEAQPGALALVSSNAVLKCGAISDARADLDVL